MEGGGSGWQPRCSWLYGRSNATALQPPPSRPAALTALRAAAALPVDGTVGLLTTGAPALGVQPAQGSHLTNNCSQHREGPKMCD